MFKVLISSIEWLTLTDDETLLERSKFGDMIMRYTMYVIENQLYKSYGEMLYI